MVLIKLHHLRTKRIRLSIQMLLVIYLLAIKQPNLNKTKPTALKRAQHSKSTGQIIASLLTLLLQMVPVSHSKLTQRHSRTQLTSNLK